VSRGSREVW